MIDTDKYEEADHPELVEFEGETLGDTLTNLITEIKRLRDESKKKGNVLSTLDEMIRNEESHVEMMKALEQGLDLPETWKEMIE